MHRPMRIAAAAVAFLLCLSVCGCGILRKAPDKEPAAQQPVSDVQQEQNMPRLNESEQKGRDVAATIESMTECKVVKENEEKCVMKITAPDMQYVMRRAMEQLQERSVSVEEYDAAVNDMLADIQQVLSEPDVPMVTTHVELDVADGDPVYTAEYYNALYGGLFEATASIEALYMGDESE